eukprot:15471960-Alexandrium_andersonii.AAC.1
MIRRAPEDMLEGPPAPPGRRLQQTLEHRRGSSPPTNPCAAIDRVPHCDTHCCESHGTNARRSPLSAQELGTAERLDELDRGRFLHG